MTDEVFVMVPGDHPRLRGEHGGRTHPIGFATGSSPLARGALGRHRKSPAQRGIIPACAGSTAGRSRQPAPCQDHPRLRGEHGMEWLVEAWPRGSSPLARGAHQGGHQAGEQEGIIPACAGSTRGAVAERHDLGDHPRLRGEHVVADDSSEVSVGSSPLARGAPGGLVDEVREAGIIPACAGSTTTGTSPRSAPRDHTRLRGEHPEPRVTCAGVKGSSPLARGAPIPAPAAALAAGIIPACAGSTCPPRPWP